ncbi:hypothetical protein CDL15_Pgr024745 [Punica granatum]|uniref:Protein CMSS1 n=1 Tax=Punica granatum TaxID=22663 RepID=A0A218W5U6_PUNGR|nr:hypothetical protein CDL15_Pgr024745 [Punica granatum]
MESRKPSLRNPNDSLSVKAAPFKKKPTPTANNASSDGNAEKKNKKIKKQPKQKLKPPDDGGANETAQINDGDSQPLTPSEQLKFFIDQYQSANNVQLSSLELESINETCILDLPECSDGDDKSLGKQIKVAFGPSWKEVLYEKDLVGGKVDPGSPAVLVIATGFRSLTKECNAAKLFSKHIKVEEQVTLLKNRVNIAGGTPSRIKKLINIEALGLSRLSVLLIDLHVDVKGYSLLTLPQVRDEFWDLYKNYFHQRLLDGNTKICLYGPIQSNAKFLHKKRVPKDE